MRYYYEAIRYAGRLNLYPPFEARDLVHDSYVAWYNKTKSNLFEESPRTIFSVVRNVFRDKLKRSTWTYDKENQGTRQIFTFEDQLSYDITPLDEVIGEETKNELVNLIETTTPPLKDILYLRMEGYTNKEISEALSKSKAFVTHHLKKVKWFKDRRGRSRSTI